MGLEEDLTVLRIHVPLLTPCPWSLTSWRWPHAPKSNAISSHWPLSVQGWSAALQTQGSFPEAPAKPAASSGSRWPAEVRTGGTKVTPSNKDKDDKGKGATGAQGTRRAQRLLWVCWHPFSVLFSWLVPACPLEGGHLGRSWQKGATKLTLREWWLSPTLYPLSSAGSGTEPRSPSEDVPPSKEGKATGGLCWKAPWVCGWVAWCTCSSPHPIPAACEATLRLDCRAENRPKPATRFVFLPVMSATG